MSVVSLLPALALLGSAAPSASDEAAALVVSATGQLIVAGASGRDSRPLRVFDWIPAGAIVRSGAQSGAVLALASGRRYDVGSDTSVRVDPESLEVLAGRCREQGRVAPLPRLAALSAAARPGTRAGALRIRGRRIRDLYPAGEAAVPAEAAALRFSPLPGIARYTVEIDDEAGESVFRGETVDPVIAVPPGTLKPGARYQWLVRGASAQGPARGEAEFATLEANAAAARARLRTSLEGAEDAASLALLAEVDRGLGLLREARDTFARALEASPGDQALREAVERVEAQLRDLQPPE